MLRPRKRYTVHDLRQLKGKRCLTHIHVKSPEEAAAAEQAGVDLMSCSFDSPEAQARLPLLVAAAPTRFLSAATPPVPAAASRRDRRLRNWKRLPPGSAGQRANAPGGSAYGEPLP